MLRLRDIAFAYRGEQSIMLLENAIDIWIVNMKHIDKHLQFSAQFPEAPGGSFEPRRFRNRSLELQIAPHQGCLMTLGFLRLRSSGQAFEMLEHVRCQSIASNQVPQRKNPKASSNCIHLEHVFRSDGCHKCTTIRPEFNEAFLAQLLESFSYGATGQTQLSSKLELNQPLAWLQASRHDGFAYLHNCMVGVGERHGPLKPDVLTSDERC